MKKIILQHRAIVYYFFREITSFDIQVELEQDSN